MCIQNWTDFYLQNKVFQTQDQQNFMCTTCYISMKNNKMPKLALQMVYGL
jgi:hypothetical protein